MATVVRVKRRKSEDPAEALIVSCKKQRQDAGPGSPNIKLDEKIRFSYAGTLNSKDVPVSRQIREAITKEKLQAGYKQHVMDIAEACRSNHRAAAKASRYRVVSKRRSGVLDCGNGAVESEAVAGEEVLDAERGFENRSAEQTEVLQADICAAGASPETEGTETSEVEALAERDNSQAQGDNNSDSGSQEILHVYDVEQDEEESPSQSVGTAPNQASRSGITVNGVELISERVPPPRGRSSEAYVYDLYYINGGQYDFRALENILSIQALHDELVLQGDRDQDCEEVYEDEDDSNDEDNWRNDYPNEDPNFFENAAVEYYYGEDMLGREPEAFDYGEDDDLADWMSARCNVDDEGDLPSDGEDMMYRVGGRPVHYQTYVRRVHDDLLSSDDEPAFED